MAQPGPEKRATRRFSLDLPISVKFLDNGERELAGHTRDVSSRGVFMYLDTEISAGAPIEFVMTLPPEITLADPIRVRCMGKILRVDKAAQGQGVAVTIEKYDFVGEEKRVLSISHTIFKRALRHGWAASLLLTAPSFAQNVSTQDVPPIGELFASD